MKNFFCLITCLVALVGCSHIVEKQAKPDHHTSQLSLDWQGSYYGVLPCADCEGIETELHLIADENNLDSGQYERLSHYLGKEDGRFFKQSGTFQWQASGRNIELINNGDIESTWQVRENALQMLDQEGDAIQSELSAAYRLEKIQPQAQLTGKMQPHSWVFLTLNSETINSSIPAHIQFNAEEERVSGFATCNRLLGRYEATNRALTFSRMAMTRKACQGNIWEAQINQALQQTRFYRIENQVLYLYDKENKQLASLVQEKDA